VNNLRDIVMSSPQLRGIENSARQALRGEPAPQPLGSARWDWQNVKKILLVRLRSIGDTVLATSSAVALKRFLPEVQLDILVEDWVAPLLDGHPSFNNIIVMERGGFAVRARTAHELRQARYDVAYNLHGGTTATLLTRASGARHRVGFATYQYAQLHNHRSPSATFLWGQDKTHSVEQQLALLGWTGVPVSDRPPTKLAVTRAAANSVERQLAAVGLEGESIALIHPAAAFATKQWATENFARVVDHLAERGIKTVAVAGPGEGTILEQLRSSASVPVLNLALSLPEVTALAARSRVFVGNDSGIAHIAAAVGIPTVVVFGSSNIAHWRPWTRQAAEVVFEEMPCQPCHGYFCEKFAQPECILRVPVSRVTAAIDRVMK
jgi:heptosyltransferase-3